MNEKLRKALDTLNALPSSGLKPVQLGDAREQALIDGLNGLAEVFGKEIEPTRIDARGDMKFNVIGEHGAGPGSPSGRYGEGLADWLSTVPRATGVNPTNTPALPENGWCRINHFDVEKLVRSAAEHMLDDTLDHTQAPAAR